MGELIFPPPAQRAFINYLAAGLAGLGDTAVVSDTIRNVRSVRVVETGGGETSSRVLFRLTLTIEALASTTEGASELMGRVAALMSAASNTVLDDGSVVYEVGSYGGGAYTPTVDNKPRYVRVFTVGMRGIS